MNMAKWKNLHAALGRTSIVVALVTGISEAQCSLGWVAEPGLPTPVVPYGTSAWWDPDAAGPQSRVIATCFNSFTGSFPFLIQNAQPGQYDLATDTWTSLGGAVVGAVGNVAVFGGQVYVYGNNSGNIWFARWTGSNLQDLASPASSGQINCAGQLPNGDIVVGGTFTTVGGAPASRIATWNGMAWNALGSGPDGNVTSLVVRTNGDLVVSGEFGTAGGPKPSGFARWTGSAWSPMGAGPSELGVSSGAYLLRELSNGDLVSSTGNFINMSPPSSFRRWTGSSWVQYHTAFNANQSVTALCELPDGDMMMAGSFFNGSTTVQTMRWTGTALLDLPAGAPSFVDKSLLTDEAGDIVFVSPRVRLTTSCPATVSSSGGCLSSGGGNVIESTLPWVDSTWVTTGTGLPTVAIVIAITGLSAVPTGAVPLSSLFAQGGAGCDLLAAPDILSAFVITNGSWTSSMFLPNTPPIVGVTFHHQWLPIEVDGNGDWVAVTATNVLHLTAGIF